MRSLRVPLWLALTLAAGLLHADTVITADGSTISGTITRIAAGKLTVRTPFAGDIVIDQTRIVSLTTSAPCNLCLDNGNRLSGRLESAGNRIFVAGPEGRLALADRKILRLWQQGEEDPDLQRQRDEAKARAGKWTYELTADFVQKQGNTESESLAAGGRAVLTRPADTWKLYANAEGSQDQGERTSEKYKLGTDYEYHLQERLAWYTRGEFERDRLAGTDLVTTVAAGYGYYFIKNKRQDLRARIGALYRYETYTGDQPSEGDVGLDSGLSHRYNLTERSKLVTELTYEPSIENQANYRIQHSSYLEMPMTEKHWSLRLGVENAYNNVPGVGKEHTDSTYFARFVLSWD